MNMKRGKEKINELDKFLKEKTYDEWFCIIQANMYNNKLNKNNLKSFSTVSIGYLLLKYISINIDETKRIKGNNIINVATSENICLYEKIRDLYFDHELKKFSEEDSFKEEDFLKKSNILASRILKNSIEYVYEISRIKYIFTNSILDSGGNCRVFENEFNKKYDTSLKLILFELFSFIMIIKIEKYDILRFNDISEQPKSIFSDIFLSEINSFKNENEKPIILHNDIWYVLSKEQLFLQLENILFNYFSDINHSKFKQDLGLKLESYISEIVNQYFKDLIVIPDKGIKNPEFSFKLRDNSMISIEAKSIYYNNNLNYSKESLKEIKTQHNNNLNKAIKQIESSFNYFKSNVKFHFGIIVIYGDLPFLNLFIKNKNIKIFTIRQFERIFSGSKEEIIKKLENIFFNDHDVEVVSTSGNIKNKFLLSQTKDLWYDGAKYYNVDNAEEDIEKLFDYMLK